MLTKTQISQLLRQNYDYLETEYGVKSIGLFGSYIKGRQREGSDIDLVIEFSRPIGFRFVELAEYLEELLGVQVDILTPAGLQGIRVPHVAAEIQETLIYV